MADTESTPTNTTTEVEVTRTSEESTTTTTVVQAENTEVTNTETSTTTATATVNVETTNPVVADTNSNDNSGSTAANDSTDTVVTRDTSIRASSEKKPVKKGIDVAKVWAEEEALSIEDRRKRYRRGRYVTVDAMNHWEQYGKKIYANPSEAEKKSKYTPRDDINAKVALYHGDITTLEIDAIVNAANESCLGGGGVDGSIHNAAGPRLYDECKTLKGCPTGQTKITRGYNLPAKYVLHSVGPTSEIPDLLKSCYSTCLELVEKHNIKTVAFCGISTGIFGYPLEKASRIAIETAREWLEAADHKDKVEKIIFCTFLDKEKVCYEALMPEYFPLVREVQVVQSTEESETETMNKPVKQESKQEDAQKQKEEDAAKLKQKEEEEARIKKEKEQEEAKLKQLKEQEEATAKQIKEEQETLRKLKEEEEATKKKKAEEAAELEKMMDEEAEALKNKSKLEEVANLIQQQVNAEKAVLEELQHKEEILKDTIVQEESRVEELKAEEDASTLARRRVEERERAKEQKKQQAVVDADKLVQKEHEERIRQDALRKQQERKEKLAGNPAPSKAEKREAKPIVFTSSTSKTHTVAPGKAEVAPTSTTTTTTTTSTKTATPSPRVTEIPAEKPAPVKTEEKPKEAEKEEKKPKQEIAVPDEDAAAQRRLIYGSSVLVMAWLFSYFMKR